MPTSLASWRRLLPERNRRRRMRSPRCGGNPLTLFVAFRGSLCSASADGPAAMEG
jgi:hypothetical protein